MRLSAMRCRIRGGALVAALCAPHALLEAQSAPLTLAEVLDLQRNGVSAFQIARMAQQYCIAFALSDSVARAIEVRMGGATLADRLRGACVKVPEVRAPDILVDEDFATLTRHVAGDGLCAVAPGPGGMKVDNRRPYEGCTIPYPVEGYGHPLRIELTFAELGGAGVGVIVLGFGRDTGSSDQHTIAITTGGDVEIGATMDGRFRRLRPLARVSARERGAPSSELAVEIRGEVVDVFVNGRPIAAFEAQQSLGPGLSLGVGPQSTARFRRLVARRLDVASAGP